MHQTLFITLAQALDTSPLPKPSTDGDNVANFLAVVFALIAAVAVISLIISSITYMVSIGNPEATKKLRNPIIYSAVGLGVALSAEVIVVFVIGRVTS